MRLFERCLAQGWPAWAQWSAAVRDQVLRSVVTFINGLTASAVASQSDWPATKQIEQLRLHLYLLHGWAAETAGAAPEKLRKSKTSAPGVVRGLSAF